MKEKIEIRMASTAAELQSAQTLLLAYAIYLNEQLGSEHIQLESFQAELAALPGPYAAPAGALLIAYFGGEPAGCVALKPITVKEAIEPQARPCEMKRLWVEPRFHGNGLGTTLVKSCLDCAKAAGYTAIYLDTVPSAMPAADRIYQQLGFQEVTRYNYNPVLGNNDSLAVTFYRLSIADAVRP